MPFFAEEKYQRLHQNNMPESVHLLDWPKANKKLINKNLEEKMKKVREIVAQALAERAKSGIKVRQPLQMLQITNSELQNERELLELIKDEINVKEIIFGKELVLDVKLTPELEKEGIRREILRNVRDLRKDLKITPGFSISNTSTTVSINKYFTTEEEAKESMGTIKITEVKVEKDMIDVDTKKEIEIQGKKYYIGIKK